MKNVIHIFGASGAGTSTLGRKLSEELGYKFMDTDDYYWLPTDVPYTVARERSQRLQMMKAEIDRAEDVVISGSLIDWGDELIPYFTLAIRLTTAVDIRISRLRFRERQNFGSRISPGGDLYENHQEFIDWACAYDTGDLNMRSKAKHDAWQKLLPCKVIELNGGDDLSRNVEFVQRELRMGS